MWDNTSVSAQLPNDDSLFPLFLKKEFRKDELETEEIDYWQGFMGKGWE